MFERDTLFSVPFDKINDWSFDERVSKVFPDMIQRSIPGYSIILSMIGIIAKKFVQPNSQIYDLGCSLGAVTLSVHRNIKIPNCQIIAVDNSPTMIKLCRNYIINSVLAPPPVKILQADILDIPIDNASLVVLNFTLQFLEKKSRLMLLKKIYQGLNPKGVLVLSEKLNFEDNNIGKLFFNMHHDFKRSNGYSKLEIEQKRNMLKNVMWLDSVETHKSRLKEAGFLHVSSWFQCFNFGSIIALK